MADLETTRRGFMTALATGAGGLFLPGFIGDLKIIKNRLKLKYILGSSMYGNLALSDILPEVQKIGASAIDIWPMVHGNQREQLEEMGEERFLELLMENKSTLGCITQYKLGPFNLQEELRLAGRLGCKTIVTGGSGPKGLRGHSLKSAVGDFLEKMKPQIAVAEENGVQIAIENHGNNLIEQPDSLKWLLELRSSEIIGVALAPYHLAQDEHLISNLIKTLGEGIFMFYAWQHGMGSMTKLPKKQELLQMPGRGDLDFKPIMKALEEIQYQGWTEIFMHPYPRGFPILDTAAKVTKEINRSREYIESCIEKT
jgi:sugar phosphate isomerase/epimerase